jgi:hypothetical protein
MNRDIVNYINRLKKKAIKKTNNLPEFWQHEHLREIQVLTRVILDLREVVGHSEEDEELTWLLEQFERGGAVNRMIPKSYIKKKKKNV